ncbi:MAG: hypothetical protein SOY12_08870 [Schaedlerella sp.]|nr:hypothetical protein [Lachnospiraceae bacterium]MDY4203127.1 hypothetical protein [Schaedlerella sp.]
MKHKKGRQLLVLVLVICMSMTPVMQVSAAGFGSNFSGRSFSLSSLWERIFGNWFQDASDETEDASGKSEETSTSEKAEGTEESGEQMQDESLTLTLMEGEGAVENSDMLRAATYSVSKGGTSDESAITTAADTGTDAATILKYFPVTLYNYDPDTINGATHKTEIDDAVSGEGGIDSLTQWNGIYFGGDGKGASTTGSESYFIGTIEEGTYIIKNARGSVNIGTDQWLVGSENGITSTGQKADATKWMLSANANGSYSLRCDSGYMSIGQGEGGEKNVSEETAVSILPYGGHQNGQISNAYCVQLRCGSYYLCQWGGSDKQIFGGYDVNNDSGNAFLLYKVDDSGREKLTSVQTQALGYADWNKWTGNLNGSDGYRTYSGLAEPQLDAGKNLVFRYPDGGIFNSDASVKDIYTNVGLPFCYEDGYYTFDAASFGAYYYKDVEQGRSGTPESNTNLYYSETPQSNSNTVASGSSSGWYPFNASPTVSSETADYFFGMSATIPFTMSTNGRVDPNNDESQPIKFEFSGDDDVWVFIDGQLVLDLGGIRNSINGELNFADNTWKITRPDGTACRDMINASMSGTIFNDDVNNTTGVLNKTRETFAAADSHELTIFYLERGAGASNCKIRFNLYIEDSVSVQKLASKSVTDAGVVSPLTSAEQAQVDNVDFGFRLLKDGDPVADMNYNLINANGQTIATPSTDSNGHFTLRAGQMARFVGIINNNSYQVVEDLKAGFTRTEYTYSGEAADGYYVDDVSYPKALQIPKTVISVSEGTQSIQSAEVRVMDGDEAGDSIQFVCENYLNADIPNPGIMPSDDKIVIDYGLPVEINVLSNDIWKGGSVALTKVEGAQYGATVFDPSGEITYTLNEQLTNIEVLTYTARVTGAMGVTAEATGKVYIIPATTMYYEENMEGLVTYSDGWTLQGTAQTDPQEPGVVGTADDSPYGSDIAYKNDGQDSNGTSKFVKTADSSASFSYTFTGWGTSFFARTANNSGYMRIIIKDADDNQVYSAFRDTRYRTDDDTMTLYNIPVFTWEADNYGTYTVTVTVAKKYGNFGDCFWLDGIRVVNPLDTTDPNYNVGTAAYAADGEAHMTFATLRQKILKESCIETEDGTLSWDGINFVVFTDTNGEIRSAEEYKSNGPKEEVYLNNGQSIRFSLHGWNANSNKLYLGIKAPAGSGTVSINGYTVNINNAADCYYEISDYATITTDEDGVKTATIEVLATSSLISVTNIKVTGNVEFTIVEQEDIEVSGDEK